MGYPKCQNYTHRTMVSKILEKKRNENFYLNRFIAGILQVIPNSGHPAHLQPSAVKMLRMEDLNLCSLSHSNNGSLIMM